MSKAVVFGATGYAGSHIATELLNTGHDVVAVARHTDRIDPHEHLTVLPGSVTDAAVVQRAVEGADAIVVALPALSEQTTLSSALDALLPAAARIGARVGVVGGAGSLHVSEAGPQLAQTDAFPAALLDISNAHADALKTLKTSDKSIDWFYFSPAAGFGAHNPGTRTGQYRLGTTILLSDENGASEISGADYAIAFVDELTTPKHHRAQIHAAY